MWFHINTSRNEIGSSHTYIAVDIHMYTILSYVFEYIVVEQIHYRLIIHQY